MNPNTKELIVNLAIGLLVVVAGLFAYFIFAKEGSDVVKESLVLRGGATTGETVVLGAQVANTIVELRELKKAVADTTGLFNSRAFTNLRDFSVSIPEEAIGRENPFLPTVWKLRAIAEEERARQVGRGAAVSY